LNERKTGNAGLVVFSSLAAASFVMARRFADDPAWRGWALYSLITGIVVAGFFISSIVASNLDEHGVLSGLPIGLLQRIGIIAGWSWVAFLAVRLTIMMRSSVSSSREAFRNRVLGM